MKFNEWIVFLSSLGSIVLVISGIFFGAYKFLKSKKIDRTKPNLPICEIILQGHQQLMRVKTTQRFEQIEFYASIKNIDDLIFQLEQAKITLEQLQ